MSDVEDRADARLAEALAEVEKLSAENARLRGLLGLDTRHDDGPPDGPTPSTDQHDHPSS